MVNPDEPRAEAIRLVRAYPRMQGLAFLPFWVVFFASGVAQAAGWIDPRDLPAVTLLSLPVALVGIILGRAYYRRTFGIVRQDPAVRMAKGAAAFLGLVVLLIVQVRILRAWPDMRLSVMTVLLLIACVYRAWSGGNDGSHWFVASLLMIGAVLVEQSWTPAMPWLRGVHQALIGLAMAVGAFGDHRTLVRQFARLSAMVTEGGAARA
ncbi:MAG: hypothetical protein IT184_12235 [Acidobacteria bacterium]|nr:hypothetical protein [Acidobacteriota bacterium]